MSSSSRMNSKEKDILILGKVSTQWLEHTPAAVKLYLLLRKIQNFVWACVKMEQLVVFLLMVLK